MINEISAQLNQVNAHLFEADILLTTIMNLVFKYLNTDSLTINLDNQIIYNSKSYNIKSIVFVDDLMEFNLISSDNIQINWNDMDLTSKYNIINYLVIEFLSNEIYEYLS